MITLQIHWNHKTRVLQNGLRITHLIKEQIVLKNKRNDKLSCYNKFHTIQKQRNNIIIYVSKKTH